GMLVQPDDGQAEFFDYREIAPQEETAEPADIGVPGFVKGMEVVHDNYGTMEMADLIEPAVDKAENGFEARKPLTTLLNMADHYQLDVDHIEALFPNGQP